MQGALQVSEAVTGEAELVGSLGERLCGRRLAAQFAVVKPGCEGTRVPGDLAVKLSQEPGDLRGLGLVAAGLLTGADRVTPGVLVRMGRLAGFPGGLRSLLQVCKSGLAEAHPSQQDGGEY